MKKSKSKSILFIGLDSTRFKKEEDYKKYADKINEQFREGTGIIDEKLPIVVYDKSSTSIDLLEIKL
jgi:hypothetical protein